MDGHSPEIPLAVAHLQPNSRRTPRSEPSTHGPERHPAIQRIRRQPPFPIQSPRHPESSQHPNPPGQKNSGEAPRRATRHLQRYIHCRSLMSAAHRTQPDANHKPELALALTPFRALCGFLPLSRIASYIRTVPELTSLIPPPISRTFLLLASSRTPTSASEKITLKAFFAALISAPPLAVKENLAALTRRYLTGGAHPDVEPAALVELVLRLDSQFPGDVGVFCVFVLNYVQLEPGAAIFLGAGEPHAYISGGKFLPSLPFRSLPSN